jgi:hypothetical protein
MPPAALPGRIRGKTSGGPAGGQTFEKFDKHVSALKMLKGVHNNKPICPDF